MIFVNEAKAAQQSPDVRHSLTESRGTSLIHDVSEFCGWPVGFYGCVNVLLGSGRWAAVRLRLDRRGERRWFVMV